MSSRKIDDLLPELQMLYMEFAKEMAAMGLMYKVTCTYRPQEEQDVLYAKGRTAQGPIVTWTQHSKHTERKAFDIAMLDDKGNITWEPKAYEEAGVIGKAVGLEWGGDFKHRDLPHFQLKEV